MTQASMEAIGIYIDLLRGLGLDPTKYTWLIGNGG